MKPSSNATVQGLVAPREPLKYLGVAAVVIFSVLTAAKEVMSAHTVQEIDPFLLVFLTFGLTALVFHLGMALGWLKKPMFNAGHNRKLLVRDLIIINISTAASWLILFHALKYSEPAIVSSIMTASGPLITLVIDSLFRARSKSAVSDLLTGFGILATTLVLVWLASTGKTGVVQEDPLLVWITLGAALFSGIAVSGTTVYSKRMYERGWQPSQLMAHRFYLLCFLSLVFIIGDGGILEDIRRYWDLILIITIFGILIPIYILQIGIKLCRPVVVSSLIAAGPAYTFLFQLFDDRIQMSIPTLIGVVVLSVFVFLSVILEKPGPS
ncbi:DMT family transporter [Saccharospirillum salsuginis]|uniref:EamA domain-containing protein n=1 Tax=Saccharospirillum salsuginis TaxID=418750 RepID=A0A918KCI2_9GAMM|nr:DMT family transporter [Saccharospirillum salsuginis]GGX57529.1 hypothetical protein GCM10007392_26380 [Saccharospirillum salsuginis]